MGIPKDNSRRSLLEQCTNIFICLVLYNARSPGHPHSMYQHNVGQKRSPIHVRTSVCVGRGVVGRKVTSWRKAGPDAGNHLGRGFVPPPRLELEREQQRPSHDGALRLETNSEVNVAFLYFRTKLSSDQYSTVQQQQHHLNHREPSLPPPAQRLCT